MGTISSSVGLVTGIPIQQTVNALIKLDSGPKNLLTAQNTAIQAQQTAYTQLSAQLLALENLTNQLSSTSLYSAQSLNSSNQSILSATASSTGGPVLPGTYSYTPIRQVQAQQFTSNRFANSSSSLGHAGSLAIRYGGNVNNGISLDLLNGGTGFTPGQISITDRSGATATIDLSQARTVDDVLQAINSNTSIRVTAQANGDSFKIIDNTGAATSNLKVSEIGGGTTAASLGLAGVDASASQATGSSVLKAFASLALSQLNQGNGIRFDNALADLQVNFRDGTSATVDFNSLAGLGTQARATTQAANGINSAVTITAVKAGSDYAGVAVIFENNPAVTQGHESVTYDSTNKVLRFQIHVGQTTANDIVSAVKRDNTVSALFTATKAAGGNGAGVVSVADTALTTGPQSSAVTPGTLGSNAKIQFTAVKGGASYDGVSVQFVDNGSITKGHETVAYDANAKTLVFQIAAGQTSASDVINALNNDTTANKIFIAAQAAGSNGSGLASSSDGVSTAGGAIVEPSANAHELTIDDVLSTINAAAPGKLQASLTANGQSIQLTDLTTNSGGTFSVTDLNNSHAAADLGLTTPSSGATITGRQLLAGLNTTLLSNLNGGSGLTGLGQLQVTDRGGNSATVDLSQAVTLDDVINTINAAGLGVTASINSARNGIQLTDSTGSTTSNLIVADGDASQTAEKLGIAVNSAATSVNGGNLNLQTVSENTTLASFNGGKGVAQGYFTVTDTNGASQRISVGSGQSSVGDLITQINASGLAVHAQINSTGDGILLVDTAHGSGTLSTAEGNSTTGSDLHLLASQTSAIVGGQPTQQINGTTTTTVTFGASDSLADVVNKINAAKAGAQAALFSTGSSVNPFSLTLTSLIAGTAGQLQIDASRAPFSLTQTAAAQDALLEVNTTGGGAGTLVSSPTNTFSNVLGGATLTVSGTSTTPVTITVGSDSSRLVTTLQAIVSSYNALNSAIASDTSYDSTTNTSAVLQGDPTIQSIQVDLTNLITGQFPALGSVQSLTQLGITFNQDGSLSLSTTALQTQLTQNSSGVQQFLSTANTGISSQFKALLEQLAGSSTSLLTERGNTLTQQIADNLKTIAVYNAQLQSEQTRLLTAFYQQEAIISKLQSTLSIINAIGPIDALGNSSTSSSSTGSSSATSQSALSSGLSSLSPSG